MANIYTMPDGSSHSFDSDEEATKAYLAWEKQFGKKATTKPVAEPTPPVVEGEPDMWSKIAANPLTQFALGASKPFRGMFEMIPGQIGDEWRERNRDVEAEIKAGERAYPNYVNVLGDISDFAGQVASPFFTKMASALPAAKTVKELSKQGAVLGSLGGLTAPTGADGEERLGQGAVGAMTGGILAPVAAKVVQGVSNVVGPLLSDKSADKVAAKLAAKVAKDRADDVAQQLQASGADETAAQSALGAKSAEFSALETLVKDREASKFAEVAPNQEAARRAALNAVTPDEAAAIAAREAASSPHYTKADRRVVKVDQAMQDLFDRMDPSVMTAAARIARTEKRPFALGVNGDRISGESLHYIKRALSDMAYPKTPATGVGADEQRAVRELLDEYLIHLDYKNPEYGIARQLFAKNSVPVNQATVLNEMQSVLDKPTGGERVSPFLGVLGRGKGALLKRSTGSPRYKELSDVLDPQQMAVVDRLRSEMQRDAELARLSHEGVAPAMETLRVGELKNIRAPSLIDAKVSMLNTLLNRMEGTGGAAVEGALARMMLPKSSGGNPTKLGALMQAYRQNPQGWAGPFVKRVAPPLTASSFGDQSD